MGAATTSALKRRPKAQDLVLSGGKAHLRHRACRSNIFASMISHITLNHIEILLNISEYDIESDAECISMLSIRFNFSSFFVFQL